MIIREFGKASPQQQTATVTFRLLRKDDTHVWVEATTRFDPEIVFIDLGMPGLDGYETARRIRSLPACETRRLVALTGFGRVNVEPRLREAGFDQYLAKPAQPGDLERLLA